MKKLIITCSVAFVCIFPACKKTASGPTIHIKQTSAATGRRDSAVLIAINEAGSLQNPAWSPDNRRLLFTRFVNGYNEGPATMGVIDLSTLVDKMVADSGDYDNVNLPGACWNAITNKIVFSSDKRLHEEIYSIHPDGSPGSAVQITKRTDKKAYEPALSPDGKWVVFESHAISNGKNGIITKFRIDDSTKKYIALTAAAIDCRQPNWSPAGDMILYQQFQNNTWDIWLINTDGSNPRKLTNGDGEKTDASFSPDGKYIVYSSDEGEESRSSIYVKPTAGGPSVKVTDSDAYDGAPSWSPDGKWIAFESTFGVTGSENTRIWTIAAPYLLSTKNQTP